MGIKEVLGAVLGDTEGESDGKPLGPALGVLDGKAVGPGLGESDGNIDVGGDAEGKLDGKPLGPALGKHVSGRAFRSLHTESPIQQLGLTEKA